MMNIRDKVKSVTEAAGSLASQSAGSLCDSTRAGVTAAMDTVGDAVSVAIQSGRDAREVGRSAVARLDGGYSATRDALMDAKDMIPVTINKTSSAVQGEPAEFGKNRTLTVQASRPRLTVAC